MFRFKEGSRIRSRVFKSSRHSWLWVSDLQVRRMKMAGVWCSFGGKAFQLGEEYYRCGRKLRWVVLCGWYLLDISCRLSLGAVRKSQVFGSVCVDAVWWCYAWSFVAGSFLGYGSDCSDEIIKWSSDHFLLDAEE
ncbi:hypothetical protein L6452_43142 [Arctium lappa]|uniref:Uncharacterized protein n=1 Tax=Arctium lappa TaxID=4217 RepID=A0ACB8XKG0_ARCLA|nr:hypothetical protein L6452_43142 [Arctium lappa]